MALKIRLSRGGAKKRPFYRVVVADSRKPRDGRFIERIGSYNPMVPKDHPERFVINEERAKHWLGVGALPTNRVAQYLSGLGMVEKPAIPVQTKKDKPRAKTLERMKEQEEKAAVEEAAQADEASEEAAAEEAPAEEVAAEEAPAEEVAAEEAPVEDAAAEEVPAEEAAEEETKEEG
jgi:small subunit ribosomal protein S16